MERKFKTSSFDPKRITLVDIYSDGFAREKNIKVYGNGKMQALIFIAVTYYGESSDENAVISYVQQNATVHVQQGTNLVPLTWTKSFVSNIYKHDVERGDVLGNAVTSPSVSSSINIRVPLYFTVPKFSTGKYKWVAQLGQAFTQLDNAVTVEVIVVTYHNDIDLEEEEDIEIVDLGNDNNKIFTRVLRYKHGSRHVPNAHELLCYAGNDGLRFYNLQSILPSDHWSGNVWIPMMRNNAKGDNKRVLGAFVDYNETSVLIIKYGYPYPRGDFYADDRIDTFNPADQASCKCLPGTYNGSITANAWDSGIVMIRATDIQIQGRQYPSEDYTDFNYVIEPKVLIEDCFGNQFEIQMEWDASEDSSYEKWKVTEFVLA